MGKKDECWKYNEEFPERNKFQTKCIFCKEKITSGGIYRLKYHIAAILGHDVTICTQQTAEAIRTCLVALEEIEQDKLNRKMQLEGLRGIGSHVPASAAASTSASASASASVGCVGEGSSRPPFYPSSSARASASASASRSHTETESHTNLLQPRVRKNKMDSYFVPRTTPGSQPMLEGMGLNKEIHDAARKEICTFWYFCNIPFFAAR